MEHLNEACWEGYTQKGMKEVKGRMVPNCVPMEEGKTSRALAGLGLATAATLGGAKRVQNLEEPYKNVKTYSEPKKDDTGNPTVRGDISYLAPVDTTYNPTISGRLRAAITGRSPYTGRRVVSPDGKTVNVINPDNTNTPLDNPRNQRGTNPYKVTGGARWGHTPVASGEGPTRYDAEEEARNKMIARGVPPRELDKDYSSVAGTDQSSLPPNAPQQRQIFVGKPSGIRSDDVLMQPLGAPTFRKQKFIPRDRLDLRNQDTIPSFVPVPESSEPTDEGLKDIVQDLKKVGKVTRHTAFRAPGETQELIRKLKALQAARAEKATTVNEDEVNEYCPRCLIEVLSGQHPEQLGEAQYQGRSVPLGKPMRGDVKKFKVFVKDPKTGNVKKVNFGDKTMKIKKSNPARRRSFRARHHCDTNPGPRTKARYWSCRKW